jgi:tetratricopeptide (TPR) repeat protein
MVRRSSQSLIRGVVSFFFVSCFFFQCKCHGQSESCQRAREAYSQNKFSLTTSLLDECRASGNQDPSFLLLAARSYYFLGRYEEASKNARDILSQTPSSAEAMYLLCHIYHRQKNARASLECFTKAAEQRRPSGEDLQSVGLDYVMLDDYPDAIHWLQRAADLDAESAEIWYDLGRARMMQGDNPKAEFALKRSLELDPMSVKAENNLGVTYETENRPAEAIRAYSLAIDWQNTSKNPSEQPFLNLGSLLISQQRAKDAVPLLERAADIAPGDTKTHEQLSRALEGAGNQQRAIAEMQLAVKLDSQNPRLHFELGQMDRRAGRIADSRQELQRSSTLYGAHSTSVDH